MKWAIVFLACVLGAQGQEICNANNCKLPDCKCSDSKIPGGFEPRNTPQFVLLTFDDAVTVSNHPTYRSLLYGRKNSNQCPIGAAFFVSHEYSNYQLINQLYTQGFEIGLHSITHKDQDYFRDADNKTLAQEFADQRMLTANFGAIPAAAIQGLRMPFLQMAGNASLEMMQEAGLRYDISMPSISSRDLWPYTFDYPSTQDCVSGPCPTGSFPGIWAIPMIAWTDLDNFPCAMVDACVHVPEDEDEEGWFKFIVNNFERHYLGNRAPFGFYIHEGPVRTKIGLRLALTRFLDMINSMNDVFMVNPSQLLDWVQKPVALGDYIKQACYQQARPRRCRSFNCRSLEASHTDEKFYMDACTRCPRVYPWLGNPLGN